MIHHKINLLLKLSVILFLKINLLGCSFLIGAGNEISFEKRLKVFKNKKWDTKKPVDIYWSETAIPYIYAENDEDLFYATGVVQGFLRQSQLEIFRRLSQGRMSELIGERAHEIDTLLRIIDHSKSVEDVIVNFTEEELMVVKSFVRGINDFNKSVKKIPIDLKLLGVSKIKPWTVEELVRVHKFTGSDVNWMVWPKMLKIFKEAGFKDFWNDWVLQDSKLASTETSFLNQNIFNFVSDTGSNSFIVGASKTLSKAPIVAGDPHLGLTMPNLWFFMGQFSKNYNSLGVFMPTFPMPVMGRNKDLAWTGTNMWGLSTYFFELTPEDLDKSVTREEVLKTRWGKDKVIKIRDSLKGPVVSDSTLFSSSVPIAMTWAGHGYSNELGAFLKANKSTSTKEFIDAFEAYGQVALNMTVADKKNNIAKIHAIKQPILNDFSKKRVVQKPRNFILKYKNHKELPITLNPKDEVLVSANERVVGVEPSPTWFNPPDYRRNRIATLLRKKPVVDLDYIKGIQQDIYLEPSRMMVAFWEQEFINFFKTDPPRFINKLLKWNYEYSKDFVEPYLFEELASHFAKNCFNKNNLKEDLITILLSHASWKEKSIKAYKKLDKKTRERILIDLREYSLKIESKKWGEKHRLKLSHPLANVPYIGKYFVFYDGGYSGGNETIAKAAHASGTGSYTTQFGANLRVIFDLSDEDKNYSVLMGGQDGYLWSEHTFDQFGKWANKGYYLMPFKKESVVNVAKEKTQLNPLSKSEQQ